MIKTKRELFEYLEADAKANGRSKVRSNVYGDEIWKFIRCLRKMNYYDYLRSQGSLFGKAAFLLLYPRFHELSVKLSFSIPYRTEIGKGLSLVHYGTIIISDGAKIGDYCRIHAGVNIGANGGSEKAANIGNYVYIAPGVKIVGDIEIANGVALGAGAVVIKSINESNTTWAGVPAHKISEKSSMRFMAKGIRDEIR